MSCLCWYPEWLHVYYTLYVLAIGWSWVKIFTKQFCKCKEKKNTFHTSSDAIVVCAINHAHISPLAQITSHQSWLFPFLLPHCLVSTPISNNNQPLLSRPPTVCFVVTPTAYRPWGVSCWFYIHKGCSLSSHRVPSLKLGLSHDADEAKFIHCHHPSSSSIACDSGHIHLIVDDISSCWVQEQKHSIFILYSGFCQFEHSIHHVHAGGPCVPGLLDSD